MVSPITVHAGQAQIMLMHIMDACVESPITGHGPLTHNDPLFHLHHKGLL